jgi:His-Xaa-Ser repeat protein HxsA
MKKKVSKIAALISIAFTQSSADAMKIEVADLSDYDFKIYKSDLNLITPIYLAAHSSHASHGSHGSHRSSAKSPGHSSHSSHRSSTPKPTPTYTKQAPTYTPAPKTSNKPVTDRWSSPTIPKYLKSDPLGQKAKPLTSFPPVVTKLEKCSDSKLYKRKEVVKKVQMYLFLSGHYSNDSDKLFTGVVDAETRKAVKQFKKDNSLPNRKNTLLDASTLNTMGIVCY